LKKHLLKVTVEPLPASNQYHLYKLWLDDIVILEQLSYIGEDDILSRLAAHHIDHAQCTVMAALPGAVFNHLFALS
jgi:hypothetical protein